MLDLFDLPSRGSFLDQAVFTSRDASGSGFLPWYKPRGATLIHIILYGAGAGGGGGRSGSASAAGGGGGGGAGASGSMLALAMQVPDVLYVSPGVPGKGGAANSGGTGPTASYVSAAPGTNLNLALIAQTGTPTGGNAGTASVGGAAGGNGTVNGNSSTNAMLEGSWLTTQNTGGAPAAGGFNAVGASTSIGQNVCQGGAGGGSIGSVGAGLAGGVATNLNPNWLWQYSAAAGGSATDGANGADGIVWPSGGTGQRPWLVFSGGNGGGGSFFNAGIGGRGGRGGTGCGGGGGGGGITGGQGGDGGPSLIIITAW